MATNLTTALAFVSNVPSPIVPSSAFGVLATFVILHDFALDTIAVPCIVHIWETYLRKNHHCCCVPRKPGDIWASNWPFPCSVGCGVARRKLAAAHSAGPVEPAAEAIAGGKASAASKASTAEYVPSSTGRFFKERYAPFILRFRFLLLLVCLAFVGVFSYFASQLQASKEAPQFLPYRHPMWRAILSMRDGWLKTESDARTELYLVWGVAANDYGKFTKYQFGTPECELGTCGEVVWDEDFDPSSTKVQTYLLDTCDEAAKIESTGENRSGHGLHQRQDDQALPDEGLQELAK